MQNDTTDDDAIHQSADDALEPAGDIFNPARDEEHFSQDFETPAAPPTDVASHIEPDNPSTDTDLDAHDVYDEGLEGASNIDAQQESATQEVLPLEPTDDKQ